MKNLEKFLSNEVKAQDYFDRDKIFDERKNAKPSFSVIIPCYNSGDTLERTVASVLAQTLANLEIIIVNDCSSDKLTLEKLAQMEKYVKVLHLEKNGGLSNARNSGIRISKSDYVLCLDADDFIDETYLEKAKNIFDTKKDVSVVVSSTQTFGESNSYWTPPKKISKNDILSRNRIHVSSCVRREVFDEVGLFDTSLRAYEDWEMWIRVFGYKERKLELVEGKMFFYSVKSSSMSHSMTIERQKEVLDIIFKKHKKLYEKSCQDVFVNLQILANSLNINIQKRDMDIKRLKNSKTFRLGKLFFELKEKPYKIFVLPFEFFRILLGKQD